MKPLALKWAFHRYHSPNHLHWAFDLISLMIQKENDSIWTHFDSVHSIVDSSTVFESNSPSNSLIWAFHHSHSHPNHHHLVFDSMVLLQALHSQLRYDISQSTSDSFVHSSTAFALKAWPISKPAPPQADKNHRYHSPNHPLWGDDSMDSLTSMKPLAYQ